MSFSCGLDEKIARNAKKIHSDYDAMTAVQNRAKKGCLMGWIGSAK